MGERTSYRPGTFCWVDLWALDVAVAKRFYAELLGWELEEVELPDSPPYTVARIAGKAVCGLYQPPGYPGPPAWASYVAVEDADEVAGRAGAVGATVLAEPFDVLGMGRIALLRDPTDAVFGIWQAGDSAGAELVNDTGALTINQLNTSDPEAAQRFYADLFGWRVESAGVPGQDYWGIYNGEALNGGMMPLAPDTGAPSHWLVYFTSADLEASTSRVRELGGRVLVEPMVVPGGRIAVAQDPPGAAFGLFEGEVDP